jgi:hypothetical protein
MIKDAIIVIGAIVLVTVVLFTGDFRSDVRVYDCGMAEWHPDIPNAVKDECRRRGREEWQKQHPSKTGHIV